MLIIKADALFSFAPACICNMAAAFFFCNNDRFADDMAYSGFPYAIVHDYRA